MVHVNEYQTFPVMSSQWSSKVMIGIFLNVEFDIFFFKFTIVPYMGKFILGRVGGYYKCNSGLAGILVGSTLTGMLNR